ncbi:MAG: thioredoxin-disulfide reductase [Chloroflexia bacterium]|nr:thioredoxin-disulfide reductase [Chloroflexia bacterium]
MLYDVIILGSGPAGLTAAIYTGRSRLSTLVLTGDALGGWVGLTDVVENYPGFPEGVKGPELIQSMQQQAERFGAKFELDTCTAVDFSQHPFRVQAYGGEFQARTVVIATGNSPRKLGVPGETEFTGRGVSYCATCDGFFYRGQEIAVIGGGTSAVQEALYLTRFAERVHLIHRRDCLRADAISQERAEQNDQISFIWDTVVSEIVGQQTVTGVRTLNLKTGQEELLPVSGVFVYIGSVPNTHLFEGSLQLNEWGAIVTNRAQHTNVPGVFAAGDVQEQILLQIATAVGSGARAAMEAEKFVAELEHRAYPERRGSFIVEDEEN